MRLPRKGAKAASQTFIQRGSAAVDTDAEPPRCPLICAPRTKRGGFQKGADVFAFAIDSRKVFSNGLKVRLVASDGYPPPFRRGPAQRNVLTPFGADIEVLQSGKRIARLRVVALCNGYGQSAKCRFRKISTKR